MSKTVAIPSRPKNQPAPDQWVETRTIIEEKPAVKQKRLTIEIDPDLHMQLRIYSATHSTPIAELVRSLISKLLESKEVQKN
jgi:hypothetical protein